MSKTSSKTKTDQEQRTVKPPAYRSFRLQKRIKKTDSRKLLSGLDIFVASLRVLLQNWKVFTGIVVIYGLLTLFLVQGVNNGNLEDAKAALEEGSAGQFFNSLTLFIYMAGSSGNAPNEAASTYQLILGLIASLAVIWVLRETYAEKKVRIRDGFYRGMYPLIPFMLVLCVVMLQLIPIVIGAFLYNLVGSAVAISTVEVIVWTIVFALTALISLYMLCSSLFALYIVCLPGMAPIAALRSARGLVQGNRWAVMRKVLFLPLALFVCGGLITIPAIFIATPVAGFVFFLLTMIGLVVTHSYMYRLYRELL